MMQHVENTKLSASMDVRALFGGYSFLFLSNSTDQHPMTMSSLPIVAGTLQTDPRSGGIKRSSGVVVLPSVAEGASTYH
jgi:hypothetical protein